MSSADYAMREAMAAKLVQPPTTVTRIYARQEPLAPQLPSARRQHPHRPPQLPGPRFARSARCPRGPQPHLQPGDQRARGDRPRLQHLLRCGRFQLEQFPRPRPGPLSHQGERLHHLGQRRRRRPLELQGFGRPKTAYLYTTTYHRPNSDEVWPGRRNEPIGVYAQSSGQSRPLAEFDFTPEPSVSEVEVLLGANETIQTDAMRLFRTRVNGSEEAVRQPARAAGRNARRRLPVARSRRPARRPEPTRATGRCSATCRCAAWPKANRAALRSNSLRPPATPAGAAGGRGRGGPRMQDVAVEVTTEHPHEDAERLSARSWRRPIAGRSRRRMRNASSHSSTSSSS